MGRATTPPRSGGPPGAAGAVRSGEMSGELAVSMDDVRAAAARIGGVAHRTPVMSSGQLDEMTGASVLLKCENFQRVGAFKFRGAYNAMSRVAGGDSRDTGGGRGDGGGGGGGGGVLTWSSGNHAQAVALAGRLLGVPTTIVMPSDAPRAKLDATRAYLGAGSEIVEYDRARTTREELGGRLAHERGLTIVPPYDHPDVIAGQGTVAMELWDQAGERGWAGLDVLLVPVGGGGLVSGCATAIKALSGGRCHVVGVEPAAADDATRSFIERRLCTVRDPVTVADGARTPSLGEHTFAIVLERVDEMMTVSEGEIARAALWAMERMKLVVEPTGALGLAGVLRVARDRGDEVAGKRIGVVVSGGNLDLAMIPRLIELAAAD